MCANVSRMHSMFARKGQKQAILETRDSVSIRKPIQGREIRMFPDAREGVFLDLQSKT